MRKAFIFGIDGQDGSYLAEFLLANDYQVAGWIPVTIPVSLENVGGVLDKITLVKGDLGDQDTINALLEMHQPDEIYNLAAPSSPAASWDTPVDVGDIAGLGVARILSAIARICPAARFYQASSSELFGDPLEVPQSERTPFRPRNPYGIAKLYAHWMTVRYRQRYSLFTTCGIMFNHESPRRGINFVTRKITRYAARIKLGLETELRLGDLDARRDWGYAGDYVKAMWLMLQQERPDDYVIGFGETHSVREFCESAFGCLDLDCYDYIVQDPSLVRPVETAQLVADPRKARCELDWQTQTSFDELIKMMVENDLKQNHVT